MKHKIQKIILQELITIFLALIAFIFFKHLVQGKEYDEIFLRENILEILVTIYIPSTLLIIFHLVKMLKLQLNNPLFSIKSKLLEKTGYDFSKKSVVKISSTFSTLLEEYKSNILWELEHIELNGLEQACLTCNQIVNPQAGCSNIPNRIKKHRRIRITTIAESLIMRNSWFKKNEYCATETRLPSSIIDDDREYYDGQKETFKKYKPKKASRVLIVKKKDVKKELTDSPDDLKNFIDWNNVEYRKNKKLFNIEYRKNRKLEFKIIAYDNSLEDVFNSYTLENFFDFVISRKGRKITVFAQNNDNTLSSYDSSYENTKDKSKEFYNAFNHLFYHEPSKFNGIKHIGIAYSPLISSFEEAKEFITKI